MSVVLLLTFNWLSWISVGYSACACTASPNLPSFSATSLCYPTQSVPVSAIFEYQIPETGHRLGLAHSRTLIWDDMLGILERKYVLSGKSQRYIIYQARIELCPPTDYPAVDAWGGSGYGLGQVSGLQPPLFSIYLSKGPFF